MSGSNVQVPTCYRHPDRQTWVTCQRCGNDICPECQTQAAVGVQCPDCVRQGKQTARKVSVVKTALKRKDKPTLTYAIIILCAAIYAVQWLFPAVTSALFFWPAAAYFEPWRMLTSAFLHGGIFHLLVNMYSLWILGQALEPMLGRVRFLALYLLSAVGGSIGVLWLSEPRSAVVGASGAIFGLLGAFFIIQRKMGARDSQILVLIAINLGIGFFFPQISWQAHVGGFITGIVVGLVLYVTRNKRSQLTMWLMLAGVVAVFGVLVAMRYPLLLSSLIAATG